MVQHFVMEPVRGSRRWARRRVGGRAPGEGGVEGELMGSATRQRKDWAKIYMESTFMARNEKKKKGVMGEMLKYLKISMLDA